MSTDVRIMVITAAVALILAYVLFRYDDNDDRAGDVAAVLAVFGFGLIMLAPYWPQLKADIIADLISGK